jgi:hypothetical protein
MKNLGTIVVVLIGLAALIWMWLIPIGKEMWGYAVRPSRLLADLLDWGMWTVGGFVAIVACGLLLMARDRWLPRRRK